MKKFAYKLIDFIEKLFKINYCILYTRNFDYTKKKTWYNWFLEEKDCPFCNNEKKLLKENKYTYIIKNINPYPNTEDHILITPKRHIRTWKELEENELKEIQNLIDKYLDKDYIMLWRQFTKLNSKSQASVYHLHIHLILRK